jgi:hypothetical protein
MPDAGQIASVVPPVPRLPELSFVGVKPGIVPLEGPRFSAH